VATSLSQSCSVSSSRSLSALYPSSSSVTTHSGSTPSFFSAPSNLSYSSRSFMMLSIPWRRSLSRSSSLEVESPSIGEHNCLLRDSFSRLLEPLSREPVPDPESKMEYLGLDSSPPRLELLRSLLRLSPCPGFALSPPFLCRSIPVGQPWAGVTGPGPMVTGPGRLAPWEGTRPCHWVSQ